MAESNYHADQKCRGDTNVFATRLKNKEKHRRIKIIVIFLQYFYRLLSFLQGPLFFVTQKVVSLTQVPIVMPYFYINSRATEFTIPQYQRLVLPIHPRLTRHSLIANQSKPTWSITLLILIPDLFNLQKNKEYSRANKIQRRIKILYTWKEN